MNPFSPLAEWLKSNSMTPDEKRRMKTVLVQYATTHPVKSGLVSPYTFRYVGFALASLVLVLGGSVGLTSAANKSLPTDALYPIKLFIEEYQAKNQKSPEDVIAFETKRIETRFDEATRLAVAHKLDDATALVIQSGIEHSRSVVASAADSVQSHNPELALAAAGALETSFSSNGKILAAIERSTNQSLGTIVLAAQVTTEKIALEKTKYEHIVAMKSNDSTKVSAESKLAMIEKALPERPEPVINSTEPEPMAMMATTVAEPTTMDPTPATMMLKTAIIANPDEPVSSDEDPTLSADAANETVVDPSIIEPKEKGPDVYELVAKAKEKMNDGKYSEALVILGQAEQLMNEEKLTESLEATYSVDTEVKNKE